MAKYSMVKSTRKKRNIIEIASKEEGTITDYIFINMLYNIKYRLTLLVSKEKVIPLHAKRICLSLYIR